MDDMNRAERRLRTLAETGLAGLDRAQLLDLEVCARANMPPDEWMYGYVQLRALFSEPGVLMAPAMRTMVLQVIAERFGGAR